MADEADATLSIEPDEPAFVKAIEEMAAKMEARFKKSGEVMKTSFGAASGGLQPGQSFNQSPMAQTTKELEKQLKWAKEITKNERERREIARAKRFEDNRKKFGDDIEIDENGRVKTLRGRARSGAVQGIATGINAGSALAFGGGSAQSGLQAGSMIASALAPQIAPILNAITGMAFSALDKSDKRVESQLRAYQVGGFRGANQLTDPDMMNKRDWTGFDFERFSNLQTHLGRKTGGLNNLPQLMGFENAFGASGQAVNMLGANVRSGHSASTKDQDKALGTTFALAMGQQLERGRVGEVFDQMTQAMESNTKGVSDIEAIANRFLFISQLGPQYRGDTGASREMNQGINALSQGNKPYTQVAMLRAAGFGKPGVSYAQAWLKTQTGLDVAGGVSSEEMIKQNFGEYIPQYAKGGADQKAAIIMQLSLLTGMNGAQVKAIMDRLSAGPLSHLDSAVGLQRLSAEANMSGDAGKLITTRQQATKGERAKASWGDFLAWAGDQGERDATLSSNPALDGGASAIKGGGGSGGASAPSSSGGGGSQYSQYRSPGGRFNKKRDVDKNMPGGMHPGEDLFFPPGTAVYSPCNGVVTVFGYFAMPRAKVEKANGYAIWVRSSDDGLTWQFVHIDPKSTSLRKGSKVSKGDLIGRTLSFEHWTNSKGSKTKTHLHLGIQKGGKQVDPMDFDLSGITKPQVNAPSTSSAGGDASSTTSSTSAATPQGATGAGGASAAPSVNVTVTIADRTQHGVDVKDETSAYTKQAKQPAPGDVPITNDGHSH